MSDSPQYNKVYDINSLFAEMFSFFISHAHATPMSSNGSKCHHGHMLSNQWVFTVLENNVCQVQLFRLSYSKKCAVYYVEICTVMFVKTI